jgi:hypothetical protein
MDTPAPAAATELTLVRRDSGAPVAAVTVALTLVVVVGLAILGGHSAAEPAIQVAAGPLASRSVTAPATVAAPAPRWIVNYVPWPAIPRLESLRATRNGRLPILLPWTAGARSTHQLPR